MALELQAVDRKPFRQNTFGNELIGIWSLFYCQVHLVAKGSDTKGKDIEHIYYNMTTKNTKVKKIAVTPLFFFIAGLCEISGGYLVWLWLAKENF